MGASMGNPLAGVTTRRRYTPQNVPRGSIEYYPQHGRISKRKRRYHSPPEVMTSAPNKIEVRIFPTHAGCGLWWRCCTLFLINLNDIAPYAKETKHGKSKRSNNSPAHTASFQPPQIEHFIWYIDQLIWYIRLLFIALAHNTMAHCH